MTANVKTGRGRKSIDATASTPAEMPDKILRKSERSHEENQERAYIAASRRSDRSIEARLQSARMASEIHKRRTGKSFKVSEEIVMKEEMYEEEDDDLPRQFRVLTEQFAGTSPGMSHRLNAYVSTHVAMRAALASQIDQEFAKHFPNYPQRSSIYNPVSAPQQETSQPPQQQPQAQQPQPQPQQQTSPTSATFPPTNFPASQRHQSFSAAIAPTQSWPQNPGLAPRHASADMGVSPQAISSHPNSPQVNGVQSATNSPHPSHQSPQMANHSPLLADSADMDMTDAYVVPMTSASAFPSVPAPFTAELPNEVKQLVEFDWTDPLANDMSGLPAPVEGDGSVQWYDMPATTTAAFEGSIPATTTSAPDYFNNALHPTSHNLELPGQQSTIGTPGGGIGDSWDRWIDPESYSSDETMTSGPTSGTTSENITP